MIWGGVSFNTKTQCVRIRGNFKAARYRDEILNPVCIPHLRNNGRMTLMHDGAPAHTAPATQALLRASRINILPWQSCSPDLNPIEHIWDVIGRNVRARDPRNIRELSGPFWMNGTEFSNMSVESMCCQCAVGAGPSSTLTVDTPDIKWTFFSVKTRSFPNKEEISHI